MPNPDSKWPSLHALVTLFHPSSSQLENLTRLAENPDLAAVILIQNSEEELDLPEHPKFQLIRNANRGGLGGAFNRGAENAFAKGADYILILDQDSILPDGFVPDMLAFIGTHAAEIAAPDFFDINSNTRGSFGTYHGLRSRKAPTEGKFARSHYAISSGTIVSRKAFKKIGPYDEDLIIDHIDTDYHLRAHLQGIDIFVNREVVLKHAIGERTKHRFFGLMTIKPTHHSPLRRYYVARNSVVMIRRYLFAAPAFALMVFARFAHDALGVLFYEENKLKKIKAILKGLVHGLIGRLGAA